MFSGLIEEMGRVRHVEHDRDGARLTIETAVTAEGSGIGASVAVNGVCLTVVEADGHTLGFDVAPETLRVTTLGTFRPGDPVNLERPLRLGDRVGGHLVTGHIDGVGTLQSVTPLGEGRELTITLPSPALEPFLVTKGSVAVDGVSLTVASLFPGSFRVAIIPHTAQITTLGLRGPGAKVNLEMDLIGKHLHRLVETYGLSGRGASVQELLVEIREKL